MRLTRSVALVTSVLLASCGSPPVRTPVQRETDSAAAVKDLQASQFADARSEAEHALALDPHNSRAAAVRAIAHYQQAGNQLYRDLEMLMHNADGLHFLAHAEGHAMWQKFEDALDQIDGDLAVVAADPEFTLELCIACWKNDWNHNGRIDSRDDKLFEIEYDPHCAPDAPDCSDEIPEGDPRRRPTFKFDRGDADWARAMIGFQRGVVEIILAYRWNDLDKLFSSSHGKAPKLTIPLADPKRVQHARELFVAALKYSERSRVEYLAETDDDREWLPNPKQKNHPIPLPMDDDIYNTWQHVVGDVLRMLASDEGLSLRAVAGMVEPQAALYLPDAFLDLGALLREPSDIVIDLATFDDDDRLSRLNPEAVRPRVETFLRGILGHGYAAKMKPSPIIERLERMKAELSLGHGETLERKLHYLFWIN